MLLSSLGRWIPAWSPSQPGDTAHVTQRRLLGRAISSTMLLGVLGAPLLWGLGLRALLPGIVLSLAVLAPTMVRLCRGGDLRTTGWLLGGALLLGLGVTLALTGGIGSPWLIGLMLCPALMTLLEGRRSGRVWLLLSLGLVAMLYLIPAADTGAAAVGRLDRLLAGVGGFSLSFLILWIYDARQAADLEKAQRQQAELLAAVQQAQQHQTEQQAAMQQAQRAHRHARLILDGVGEALLLVRPDGRLEPECSASVAAWFGPVAPDATLWSLFSEQGQSFAEWLEVCWESLASPSLMPPEVVLAQLPTTTRYGERHLSLRYLLQKEDDGSLGHVLVVIQDVSAELELQAAARDQNELTAFFVRYAQDPGAAQGFLTEARELVAQLHHTPALPAEELRWIHTLKGNSAMFGLQRFSGWLHDLESILLDLPDGMPAEYREHLAQEWARNEDLLAAIVGHLTQSTIQVSDTEFKTVLSMIASRGPSALILRRMTRWGWDRIQLRLEHLAEQTRTLAERLGKDNVQVVVDVGDLRQPTTPGWRAFWSAAIHLIRNAIDHGVESVEIREAAGKPAEATITLRAYQRGDLHIEIQDDGRGIDWERIRTRAQGMGLPHQDQAALERALFADGLSTREQASDISGRGVGTSAVWAACAALGGAVRVDSTPGGGTTFRFSFPDLGAAGADSFPTAGMRRAG